MHPPSIQLDSFRARTAEQLDALEREMKGRSDNVSKLKALSKAEGDRAAALEAQLSELKAELERKAAQEGQNAAERERGDKKRIEELQEKLAAKEQSAAQEKRDGEQRIVELQEKLAANEQDGEQRIEVVNNELASLREKHTASLERVGDLEAQLKRSLAEHEAERQKLKMLFDEQRSAKGTLEVQLLDAETRLETSTPRRNAENRQGALAEALNKERSKAKALEDRVRSQEDELATLKGKIEAAHVRERQLEANAEEHGKQRETSLALKSELSKTIALHDQSKQDLESSTEKARKLRALLDSSEQERASLSDKLAEAVCLGAEGSLRG